MDERVQEFLTKKRSEKQIALEKKKQEERLKVMEPLGLFDKVYSPDNRFNEEYPFGDYDSSTNTSKAYKKVPIDVTDEEFEEIKSFNSNNEEQRKPNLIATIFTAIAWIIYIFGFIAGVALGTTEVTTGYYYTTTETVFSFAVAFTYWSVSFVSGTMFLGFAEIIKLLNDIKNK